MHPFETMPADAKVWVYAANRKLSTVEQKEIIARANTFTNNWKSHGQSLKAVFDILHDVFLVLMVDEQVNPVGGCGTDESIHFMQALEKDFHISLFNRFQVELIKENELILTTKADALKLYNEKQISGNTIFFNKNTTLKKDFDMRFMIPYSESWAFQGARQAETV